MESISLCRWYFIIIFHEKEQASEGKKKAPQEILLRRAENSLLFPLSVVFFIGRDLQVDHLFRNHFVDVSVNGQQQNEGGNE